MKIVNATIETIDRQNDAKLKSILKNDPNLIKLLPQKPHSNISFELHGTCSAFANIVRRHLMSRISSHRLTFDMEKVSQENKYTNSGYALIENILRNINYLPLDQEKKLIVGSNPGVSLNIRNTTNDMLTVTSGHFTDPHNIIIDKNIPIFSLHPGTYLSLKNELYVIYGDGIMKDYFSVTSRVGYEILDVEPYNQFTKTGTRPFDANPTKFKLSFTLTGDVTVDYVFEQLRSTLKDRLTYCKNLLNDYFNDKSPKDLKVNINNGIYSFIFSNLEFDVPLLIAQTCFKLDPNCLHYSARSLSYSSPESELKIAKDSKENINVAFAELEKDIEKLYFKSEKGK